MHPFRADGAVGLGAGNVLSGHYEARIQEQRSAEVSQRSLP
jgi:hypothetical protein